METVDAGDVPIEDVVAALLQRDTLKELLGDHAVACFALAREALMPEFFRHLIENVRTIDGTLRQHIAFVVFHGDASSLIRPIETYRYYEYRPTGLSVSDRRVVKLSRYSMPRFDADITNSIRLNPRNRTSRSVATAIEFAVDVLMQQFGVSESDLPCLAFTDHGTVTAPFILKLSPEDPIRSLYTDVLAPISAAFSRLEPLWNAMTMINHWQPPYDAAAEIVEQTTTRLDILRANLGAIRNAIAALKSDITGRREEIEALETDRAGRRELLLRYKHAKTIEERLALVDARAAAALGIPDCVTRLRELEADAARHASRPYPGRCPPARLRKEIDKQANRIFSLIGKAMLDSKGRIAAIEKEFTRIGRPLSDLEHDERRTLNAIADGEQCCAAAQHEIEEIRQRIDPAHQQAETRAAQLRQEGVSEHILSASMHGARMVVEDLWMQGLIGSASPKTRRASKQLKILLLSSNPRNETWLDLEEEIRAINQELRGVKHRDHIQLIPCPAGRPDDLLRALRDERPDIVHFSGHGDVEGIVLRHDRNDSIFARTESLARLFKDRDVRLVVLNSCFSQDQARAIAMSVPVVVGTTKELNDEAAIRFSAVFYRTLGNGYTVADAFRDGGDSVDLHNLPDVYRIIGNPEFAVI